VRRPMANSFTTPEGVTAPRARSEDFGTLGYRVWQNIIDTDGFVEGDIVVYWVNMASRYYCVGWYANAYNFLNGAIERLPALEPLLFYYRNVCLRMLNVPLTVDEAEYQQRLTRWQSCPKWLRWTLRPKQYLIRCKWCGRYTPSFDPNKPTFGFADNENCCGHCLTPYANPDWIWDSPDGRAYSFYRGSIQHDNFLRDFLADYDPAPSTNGQVSRE
jgi:hypothetical protein